MKPTERELRMVARRHGFKQLVTDRPRKPGAAFFYLRPIADASQAVRQLPGGGVDLVRVWGGRRKSAVMLQLADVERLLASYALIGLPAKRSLRWK
jgi:hypothetical protein